MIKGLLTWVFVYASLLFFQYVIAEYYIILKKGHENVGYILIVLFQIGIMILCIHMIFYTEYLDFLGIAFLCIAKYAFFKFIDRMRNRNVLH